MTKEIKYSDGVEKYLKENNIDFSADGDEETTNYWFECYNYLLCVTVNGDGTFEVSTTNRRRQDIHEEKIQDGEYHHQDKSDANYGTMKKLQTVIKFIEKYLNK